MVNTKKHEGDFIDGWVGMADAIAKASKVQHSQCRECKNKIGTHACKIFGIRPRDYASALTKVQCPERKEK